MRKPKIIIYDIETTPNVGFTWGKYEQNVIEFLEEWQLLSFAWKELGSSKVSCTSRRNFNDPTDKELTRALWKVLNTADVVITHNGKTFDNKKANAKFVEHGFAPVSPAAQVDTKELAKSQFAFTSNSLDDLGKRLKCGRKIKKMDFSVWLGCMNKDPDSFELMEKYNVQDVVLLEKIYLKLRPWAVKHPNVAQLSQSPTGCPRCGSQKLEKLNEFKYTARTIWRMYKCRDCKSYCRGETVKLFQSKHVNL
jgi:RNase_H superfamily